MNNIFLLKGWDSLVRSIVVYWDIVCHDLQLELLNLLVHTREKPRVATIFPPEKPRRCKSSISKILEHEEMKKMKTQAQDTSVSYTGCFSHYGEPSSQAVEPLPLPPPPPAIQQDILTTLAQQVQALPQQYRDYSSNSKSWQSSSPYKAPQFSLLLPFIPTIDLPEKNLLIDRLLTTRGPNIPSCQFSRMSSYRPVLHRSQSSSSS